MKKSKRAISRTALSVLVGLFIIGLGLGVGSLYALGNVSPGSNSHSTTVHFPPVTTSKLNGSVSVYCSPAPLVVGSRTSCTATLTSFGKSPTGTVSWKSNQTGAFSPSSNCTLSSGSCAVIYKPSSAGVVAISGNYSGDQSNPSSFAIFYLTVGLENSQTFLSCSTIVTVGESSKCTATVAVSNGPPSGNVTFATSGSGVFNPMSCTLIGGSCTVEYTPTNVSSATQNLTASYKGDSNNNPSSSTPYYFTVGARQSSTSISCSPTSVTIGSDTTCTVTIAGYNPTGNVFISSSDGGATFNPPSPCTLSSGSCQVTYAPSVVGPANITASYSGDVDNLGSFGSVAFSVGIATSHVSVSCSPSSVTVGSQTTCTASVSGYKPTGTVSWSGSGMFSSGTCTISSGSCSVSYAPTSSTSPQTITASYSGDTNNAHSSGAYSLTVTLGASSTSVSCSPVAIGSSTMCTASVTGVSPTGTVSFSSTDTGATFSPSSCALSYSISSVNSCQVTYTPSVAGTATVTAQYSGDSNNKGSSGTFDLSVAKASTSMQLACAPSSVNVGSTTTCTATISGGFSPGGTVRFTTSGSGSVSPLAASCALSGVSCSISFTGATAGSVTLTASYVGDMNNDPSSGTYDLNIGQGSSSVSVSCSPGSVTVGSPTTCTAKVTGNNPTGTVSWQSSQSGTSSPGTCTLSSGSCSVTYTPTSTTSPVTITASYSGDANNAPSSGTFSLTVSMSSSSTKVSCSPGSVTIGSPTTCTATVSGHNPTGTVSWQTSGSGAFSSTSCALSSGQCQVTYTPSATGSVMITASYAGDGDNKGSSGNSNLNVGPASSSVSINCSPSTINSTIFQSTTCTVTVTGYNPTGSVSFSTSGSGSVSPLAASCALSGGTCQVTFTAAGPGSVAVTASYGGDSDNNPSSNSFTLTIVS